MNTSGIKLLNQIVTCGKPTHKKLVTFIITEENANYVKAIMIECAHHDEHVVEHFNATYKNTEITAKSMNNLKDQMFDMLVIPKSQIGNRFSHTAHWMDVMRIDGATINKLVSKPAPAPVSVPAPASAPAPVTAEKTDIVKTITVSSTGKLYLLSKKHGTIYDYARWHNDKVVFEIGKWNESANKIDFDEQEPVQEPVLEPELRRWDPVTQTEYFIYIIKGKDFAYVGLTTNFGDRKNSHKSACKGNLNKNFKGCDASVTSFRSFKTFNSRLQLYTAINNNGGWDAVEMNIVQTIVTDDIEVAHKYEQYWINQIYLKQPEIEVLNRNNPMKSFVKCSDPFCESKTKRVCSTCKNCSACKKHSVCLSCKDIEAWKKREYAAAAAAAAKKDEKETNRERARNAYRMKVGIPLDAPLIQRGGAHNVKYHTPEQKAEKQEMDREYQREYQKKYREKKMQDNSMMMEIDKNINSPIYMMSFLLESLKNKKLGKCGEPTDKHPADATLTQRVSHTLRPLPQFA